MSLWALPFGDNLEIARIAHRGIPASALSELAASLRISLAELGAAVGIPRRTLDRRVAENERLKVDESDRTLRLARLFARAVDVFGSEEDAADWFSEPVESLGGVTPLDLGATDAGVREIEQTLGRIEHGVFS